MSASFPIDYCCGYETDLRSDVQEVRLMVDPPRTLDRWLIHGEWQCMVTQEHHGTWTETTDDPEYRPWRCTSEPTIKQRIK